MPSHVIKRGEGFELDRGAYELRRSGCRLRLERIPWNCCSCWWSAEGTGDQGRDHRKDLGQDVFLDTDSSINAAIRKIRQVLKDDQERPLFVQTITGKGYRFLAAVEKSDLPSLEKKLRLAGVVVVVLTRRRVFSAVSRRLKYPIRSEARHAGSIALREPQ